MNNPALEWHLVSAGVSDFKTLPVICRETSKVDGLNGGIS